jgi:hypothetical protein
MPTSKDALAGRVAEMTLALICVRFGDADRGIPGLERLLKLPGGRPPVTLATLRVNLSSTRCETIRAFRSSVKESSRELPRLRRRDASGVIFALARAREA